MGTEDDVDAEPVLTPLTGHLGAVEAARLADPLENARAALRASRVAGHEDWSWPNNGGDR
jgi:hypothetical protein